MGQLYCIIPMTEFTAASLAYVLDDIALFRISAVNAYGTSTVSATNSAGAQVRTVPGTMNAPVRGSSSTLTQIEVTWTALSSSAETGNSAITSYHLEWDSGTNGATFTTLTGATSPYYTSTSYTVTSSLTAGNDY